MYTIVYGNVEATEVEIFMSTTIVTGFAKRGLVCPVIVEIHILIYFSRLFSRFTL